MAYNIFERWPFTSFQNLNLDWLLKTTKEAAETAETAATTVQQYNDRLASVENDNIQQDRDIMSIQNVNNQQNQRIDALETDVDAHEQTIRSLQGWNQEQDSYINGLISSDTRQDARIAEMCCEIRAVSSPFTSSINYENLYRILYTDKHPVNFILTDASNVKYETALAYVGSDKIRAIFIMDRANSSQSYGVIYADILSNNTVELRTDSITTGGGGSAADAVLYVAQTLTDQQKQQARTNIGAGTSSVTDVVQYTAQTLTDQQKQQARTNIGAGTTTTRVNAGDGTITITDPYIGSGNPLTYQYKTVFLITAVYSNGEYTFDRNQADILSAIVRGQLPIVRYHTTAGQSDYDVYHEWVFSYYTYDGEDVYIYFSRVDQQGNVSQMRWFASTGKAVVVTTATLPAATGADDGKIPMVNSFGNYQLVTIPAAENTSFGT